MTIKTEWYRSLLWKLMFPITIISFVPIFIFGATTITSVEDYFMVQRQNRLIWVGSITSDRVFRGNYLFDPATRPAFEQAMHARSQEENVRILILDTMATVVLDTGGIEQGNTLLAPEVISILQYRTPLSVIQPNGTIRYTAVPITNEINHLIGVTLLVSSVQDINDLVDIVSTQMGLLNLATAIFAVASAFFVSYVILSPLKRLLRAVQRMSDGHLDQRVKITGNDEFSRLCHAFNEMNEKLQKTAKTREEFVSNVSHELKTPISSMKVLGESILTQEDIPQNIYHEFLQDIVSEVDRMDLIINDLLTLVRLDQTDDFINVADISLNQLCHNLVKSLTPLAKNKLISLSIEDKRYISIKGDELKLTLAISNIIENGIKYTPEGGSVNVTVSADSDDALIIVRDTGIGIAEDEFKKIFTRFYRTDQTRDRSTGGTGLGLSITHTTVLLHNGSVQVRSKKDVGSTFIVRIPLYFNYTD